MENVAAKYAVHVFFNGMNNDACIKAYYENLDMLLVTVHKIADCPAKSQKVHYGMQVVLAQRRPAEIQPSLLRPLLP